MGSVRMPRIHHICETPVTIEDIRHWEYKDWTPDRVSACECGSTEFIMLPTWSNAVREGGKRYLICAHCGGSGGHL